MITLADALAARERIAPWIRATPTFQVSQLSASPTDAALVLKLENLQVTGSFKARGATNKLLTTPPGELRRGIVTASGGNHGLATARAARLADVPATIFVPATATAAKQQALRTWGADVRVVGDVWDEANEAAQRFAADQGAAFFHPFADPAVVAGQSTLALDILDTVPDLDAILIAVGGGGLLAGMSTVFRAISPRTRIIGIEPIGSPTLHTCLAAGMVVSLAEITTRVATMACRRTGEGVFDLIRRNVDEIVLISDADMLDASRWLWSELAIAADLSGAAAIAALRCGAVRFQAGERVCALVCGAGPDGIVTG
jgi:threonine dehydratase